jgi:hypothetical protein
MCLLQRPCAAAPACRKPRCASRNNRPGARSHLPHTCRRTRGPAPNRRNSGRLDILGSTRRQLRRERCHRSRPRAGRCPGRTRSTSHPRTWDGLVPVQRPRLRPSRRPPPAGSRHSPRSATDRPGGATSRPASRGPLSTGPEAHSSWAGISQTLRFGSRSSKALSTCRRSSSLRTRRPACASA